MGGSGGSIPIGGIGIDKGIQELNCPRKFETTLVDVIQAGNTDYAFGLEEGTELTLEIAKNGGVAITHDSKLIGYLPPQYNVIIDCIASGWKYAASILEVKGDRNAPHIRVMVIGAPG
jgi:hypothetical protein